MVTKNQQKGYINVMKYHNNIPKSIKSVRDFRVKVLEHKEQYGIASVSHTAVPPRLLSPQPAVTTSLPHLVLLVTPSPPAQA